jgi:hypothetical protein
MSFGPECHHVRFNGQRCGSPALRGKVYCYYHARVRTAQHSNIVVPEFDSHESAAYAGRTLLQLMLNRKITVGEYRASVYGMRHISNAIANFDTEPKNTVTEVSRHVAHEIGFAGPDADPEEQPETSLAQAPPTEQPVGQSLSPEAPRSETPQLSEALNDPFIPDYEARETKHLHDRRPDLWIHVSARTRVPLRLPIDTYRRIIATDEPYPGRTPVALRDYLDHEYRKRHAD